MQKSVSALNIRHILCTIMFAHILHAYIKGILRKLSRRKQRKFWHRQEKGTVLRVVPLQTSTVWIVVHIQVRVCRDKDQTRALSSYVCPHPRHVRPSDIVTAIISHT